MATDAIVELRPEAGTTVECMMRKDTGLAPFVMEQGQQVAGYAVYESRNQATGTDRTSV